VVQNSNLLKKGKSKPILDKISFDITKGKILSIVGETGSGKTTLAKLISKILIPTSGELIFNGKPFVKNKPYPIQLLFQNTEDIINPFRKADNVLSDIKLEKDKREKTLELIGIDKEMLSKKGYQLSGGERQRIALARILLTQPEVLIIDEPFSAQDPDSKFNFANLFRLLNKQFNLTIVIVTHEIDVLKNLADEVIVLYAGKLMEFGTFDEVIKKPLHPYSKFLFDANEFKIDKIIKYEKYSDEINDLACPFYVKCSFRSNDCKERLTEKSYSDRYCLCNYPLTD